ncbi:MAG: GlsB/YeaQ/YmgE family stress response membrane protein [Actinobacteria bacterium]|nr:GlsB/YeaQ/YmgE family stress response membrane protein [Actinomycetota bacterium]
MNIVVWILVGLAVGAIARLLLPGRDPIGCLGTIAVGVLGALIGGTLWTELFGPQRGVAWIGSVIVAMLILGLFRNVTYRRRRGRP